MAPAGRRGDILPDRLADNLAVWFVGTAAGPASAAAGAYYAHPGNRFWRTLHETGITPRRLAPHQYGELLSLGIGLTDICKTRWGVDADIPPHAFDPHRLRAKVRRLRPQTIAFTSKKAASLWLRRDTNQIGTGRQATEDGRPLVFVLPSPSGLATSYWSIEPWRDLAGHLASRRPAKGS